MMLCVIIVSDNGLLPIQCQAILKTNMDSLSTGDLQRHLNGNLFTIQSYSLKENLKILSATDVGHSIQISMS